MTGTSVDQPREWTGTDLARAGLPLKSLSKARAQLGIPPPWTAKEVYWLIERTYQLSGAWLSRAVLRRLG